MDTGEANSSGKVKWTLNNSDLPKKVLYSVQCFAAENSASMKTLPSLEAKKWRFKDSIPRGKH